MKLTIARVEVLVWVLIYIGLLTLAIGLALRPAASRLGAVVAIAGVAMAAAGVFLIVVRSRMGRAGANVASKVPSESTRDKP